MKRNMGAIDRVIRIALALLIAVLYLAKAISGVAAIILGIIAVLSLITGFMGVCPAYWPFKISTCGKGETKRHQANPV